MNIGETTKAIKVERIGGPAQPKVTPAPVEVPVAVTAETRTLVTA